MESERKETNSGIQLSIVDSDGWSHRFDSALRL